VSSPLPLVQLYPRATFDPGSLQPRVTPPPFRLTLLSRLQQHLSPLQVAPPSATGAIANSIATIAGSYTGSYRLTLNWYLMLTFLFPFSDIC